jgi:cytidyltransferase-like protein
VVNSSSFGWWLWCRLAEKRSVKHVVVAGSFDDLRSRHVRLLEEAAKLGRVCVLLWPDEAVHRLEGKAPKFSQEERRYLLEAIRYVDRVTLAGGRVDRDSLPPPDAEDAEIWAVDESGDTAAKQAHCCTRGLEYRVLPAEDLNGFPGDCPNFRVSEKETVPLDASRKRVIVTGCYDWFHSGHVRFFEEVSQLGDLYVVVGHDANIRLLKGEGHPLFPEQERRYMVQSVRFVKQALVSTGHGWLDAEPEIERIGPHVYAVNEDGDRPEKRQFCEAHGIEYRVLKRVPKQGLPQRQSTTLRGF